MQVDENLIRASTQCYINPHPMLLLRLVCHWIIGSRNDKDHGQRVPRNSTQHTKEAKLHLSPCYICLSPDTELCAASYRGRRYLFIYLSSLNCVHRAPSIQKKLGCRHSPFGPLQTAGCAAPDDPNCLLLTWVTAHSDSQRRKQKAIFVTGAF